MKKGKFIVVDGGEGSGKTTMVALAKEHFPEMVFTREPGGSPFAEKIRAVILSPEAKDAHGETQFGLFWAARFDHLQNTIIPALQRGVHVLSDRFDSSSFVYQMHGQEARHLRDMFWKMREVYVRDGQPDLYIFLDVEPEVGLSRVAKRKETTNHFDDRALDFHKRIRNGYFEFLKSVPHVVINANQSTEEVRTDFLRTLKQVLG
ncbi:dTMP kinase [Candidatus Parcubacteria bacterium]|nr:dTMP kinase [Candidatus Parcubacteria bacterium]